MPANGRWDLTRRLPEMPQMQNILTFILRQDGSPAHFDCEFRQYLNTVLEVRLKRDGARAETRFRLSAKRMSPFKSAGASVQLTAGSRCVRISGSNAGYTTFRGSVTVLATHSIRQFPLHFPSRASPCAITFQTHSTRTMDRACVWK